MTLLELLACGLLVTLSATMSASEIALFSLSRFQLRYLKENFRPVHRKIKNLLADPGGLLITILVVNEVLNIALTSMITETISKAQITIPLFASGIPTWAFETAIGTLISAPIILLICEITPKVIAARTNQLVATLTVGPLTIIYKVLSPMRYFLTHFIKLFFHTAAPSRSSSLTERSSNKKNNPILKESDFLLLVEEGHKEGAIQETELELIRNVFELDDTSIAEVSTPLPKVLSLTADTTVKDALISIKSQRYSRIPIVDHQRKEVVGILYSKDLLRYKLDFQLSATPISALMRKPFFVNSGMRLNALFRIFKQQKIHMAIVKDPNGEIAGVVTMSDLLDALFEDFFSEAELNESGKQK